MAIVAIHDCEVVDNLAAMFAKPYATLACLNLPSTGLRSLLYYAYDLSCISNVLFVLQFNIAKFC